MLRAAPLTSFLGDQDVTCHPVPKKTTGVDAHQLFVPDIDFLSKVVRDYVLLFVIHRCIATGLLDSFRPLRVKNILSRCRRSSNSKKVGM
jgi:hypothetical protein